PEMFKYWLQGGRITVGFLGGAQVDRYANLNTTVIGSYERPTVRLPGGGGAPEIASHCRETYIIMSQSRRTFVERVDFITSLSHGDNERKRAQLGLRTRGPTKLITDLCVLEPDPHTSEMIVTSLHPGVTRAHVLENTGWRVRFAERVD